MANEFKVKNGLIVSGSADIEQDLRVRGTLTVDELHTSIVTSSIIYESGSTKFGNSQDDEHDVTGSLRVTGSIILNGEIIGSGKLDEGTFNSYTASNDLTNATQSQLIDSLLVYTSSYNLFSSSVNSRFGDIETTTGSLNSFTSSTNTRLESIETSTSSLNIFTSSAQSSLSSLNSYTSSNDSRLSSVESTTSSLNSFTSSADSRLNSIETSTGSLNNFTNSINTTIKSKLDSENVVSSSIQIDITGTTGYSTFSSSIATTDSNQNDRLSSLESTTGSLNSYTSSNDSTNTAQNNRLNSLESTTGSLNSYTSSNDSLNTTQNNRLGSIESTTSSLNSFSSSILGAIEITGSNVTVKGDLRVKGTTTQIDSTTLNIGDNIISLNGTATNNGGIIVQDALGDSIISGSLLWDTATDYWKAGTLGNEQRIVLENEYNTLSTSIDSRVSSLQSTTSSLNSYTSSTNNRLTSIETSTGSLNDFSSSTLGRLTSIETSTGSLNTFTTSTNGRLNSLESESSSIRTDFNSYTSSTNTSLNSIQTATSSLNSFTSSTISKLTSLENASASIRSDFNSYTSSNDSTNTTQNNRLNSLESTTGSLNTFTSSANGRLNSLESASSSIRSDFNTFTSSYKTVSGSINTRLTTLETYSGSYSGSLNADFIQFNTSSTAPGAAGRLVWNSAEGTLDLGMGNGNATLQLGQEMYYPPVFNTDSVTIREGMVVMVNPTDPSQGDQLKVIRGDASGTYPSKLFVGIATEDISVNGTGLITWFGKVRNLNINNLHTYGVKQTGDTWNEGTILYADPQNNGGLTSVEPTAPNLRITLAIVSKINGNNYSLLIRPTLNQNIGELNDVKFNGLSQGDLIARSGSTWINTNQLSGSYGLTGSLSISGSQTIVGSQTISGSLVVLENLQVFGSSSITFVTASQLALSTSFISVNVFEPAERFGGIKVYDSGSSAATASLMWDSLNNKWIYQNASGSNYSGGMLIMGPRNTGSLGEEVGTIANVIMKGQGGDHITGSNITDDGSNVRINSNTTITGSLNVTGNISGSVDYTNIINLPTLVSGSEQINITGTTGYSTFSSSIATTDLNQSNRISALESTTSSLNSYTSSNTTNINAIHTATSSLNSYTSSTNTRLNSIETSTSSLNSYTSSTNTRLNSIETSTGSLNSFTSSQITQNSSVNSSISSLNSFTSSTNGRLNSIEGVTGSISTLNTFTGSANGRLSSIETSTGSLNTFTSSANGRLNSLESYTSSNITNINAIHTATSSLNSFTNSFNSAFSLSGADVTVRGNLTVSGTTTTINSTTVAIGDNIIQLNGTGATNAGLVVRDATSPNTLSGSFLWDTTNDKWVAGVLGSEDDVVLRTTSQTLTNKTISGASNTITNIGNSSLTNSSITIAGVSTALGGSITAATIGNAIGAFSGSSQVNHNATTNYVANEHINHTSVSITAGSGLSGGGDISATRTLTLDTGSAHFIGGTRTSLSFTAGSGGYNSSTGVITIPTNTNQLTNGAGFITSYTETDTLATVTARGATTSTLVALSGKVTLGNRSSASFNGNTAGLTINNTAEIRSLTAENPPALTWHYEGLATRHILLTSGGTLNVVSPSTENSGVAVLAVNGNTVLHAGNYNSYSPTLTGGGASGTWSINVTGNAVTTSQTNFSNLTINSNQVLHAGNYTSYTIPIGGSWGADLTSNGFTRQVGVSYASGEWVILTSNGQISTLIDGSYFAGEQGGFYSMNASNQYSSRVGFNRDGSGNAAFNASVVPTANNTLNLGSPSLGWANIYTNDLHLSNMNKPGGNDIDGTSGTWTIQEGAENLYIINNLNGKKYKINLEEI